MILQLDPPIPLDTPRGRGYAHFVIDYSQEHHTLWTVFLDATGECWTFENPEIRLQLNPSMGRHAMMKKMGKKMEANSTGALKIGGKDKDDSPGKKAGPMDKGEKGMKGMKSPMRKGK